jgi:DNA-binding IclR family transcriptional regulator
MLEEEDMLIRHPITKRVMFGRRFARVACKLLAGSPLKPLWHIVLGDLVRDVGATCNIVVYEGSVGTYFDRIEANWPSSIKFKFGSKVPLYCTAGGKLYLASLTAKERRIIIDSMRLTALTAATITDRNVLAKQLEEIRREKIGFDYEEFIDGMIAVAVPIEDDTGSLLATLAVHGSQPPDTIASIRSKVPRLREAAKHLADIFETHTERKRFLNDA